MAAYSINRGIAMIRSLNIKTVVMFGLGLLLPAYVVFQIRGVAYNAGAAPTPARPVSGLDARIRAEGRLAAYPGAQVVVGTDFAGTLTRLSVKERDIVRRGDLLAGSRAHEQPAQRAEARGRIPAARARLAVDERAARRLIRPFNLQSV